MSKSRRNSVLSKIKGAIIYMKWKRQNREKIKYKFSFLFNEYKFECIESSIFQMNEYILKIVSGNILLEFDKNRLGDWNIIVDNRNKKNKNEGISLNTIKQYFKNTQNANEIMDLEELKHFLKNNISRIIELFRDENYIETKNKLDKLDDILVRKRFPGIFRDEKLSKL